MPQIHVNFIKRFLTDFILNYFYNIYTFGEVMIGGLTKKDKLILL